MSKAKQIGLQRSDHSRQQCEQEMRRRGLPVANITFGRTDFALATVFAASSGSSFYVPESDC
jgi:hypothetical protein